jgi:hypothetical protein
MFPEAPLHDIKIPSVLFVEADTDVGGDGAAGVVETCVDQLPEPLAFLIVLLEVTEPLVLTLVEVVVKDPESRVTVVCAPILSQLMLLDPLLVTPRIVTLQLKVPNGVAALSDTGLI